MRLKLPALFFLALLSFSASAQKYLEMIEAGTYTLTEIQQEAESYFDLIGRERGSGYNPYKRWEYVAMMELDQTGVKIPNLELSKRARDYRRAQELLQAESGNFAGDWKQLGPTYWNATSGWNPGVGRVTSIGVEETNPDHIIVGSPTGGVWKTLNGGSTWTPLSDNFSTVDVFSLEISPYNNNQYLWGSTSGRIYRSTDGGASWTSTGNVTGSGKVIRIHYHPTNPDLVYAVSESNGLFRSLNSGATWTAVPGVSGVSGYDVEFKPGAPDTLYFSGKLVYRSTDGGATFSEITGFGTANNNYKMIGVSPANPGVVYVLEASGGKFGAFYKSTDSGVTFSKLIDGSEINFFGYSATGDDDKGQAPRDMDVAVSPFDAEEVHIAGVHTWKSTNGGLDFELSSHWVPGTAASLGVGYNHADIDILKFVGNTLFVGSDGGIYTSNDGAASFQDRSTGLGIREFYKIGVSKTNPNVVSGGSQDNGSSVMRGVNRNWVDWLGADGMETFVDWNNANILYGTSQYGSMYRSTNQGNSRSSISKPPDVEDGAWITPFEQDPQVSTTIYVAFADVWKSTNSGNSWTKISEFDNGNLNQMKLAPSDRQRIYVSKAAALFTTADGGITWTPVTSAWGTGTINYIAVHPQDPQRLLVVTNGSVYHSINAGSTWTNIGAGLPSGTKYCATWENTGKNGIYVGGFGFISYTNDDLGGQWTGYFTGLPTVRVYELEINYVSNTIFACTYGRGLWESPLYLAVAPVAAFEADVRQGCRSLTVQFSDRSAYTPTAWEWTFEGGVPSTSTLQNPTVTFNGSGNYTIRLKATNNVGDNTFEAINYITLLEPAPPAVADVQRCDPGEISLEAVGQTGDLIRWYANASDPDPLFTGSVFTTNIDQTSTFYATSGTEYMLTQKVGPASNNIGSGGNHDGNYFLILDAEKPFRLKAATVYATGAGNRTFQLRDTGQNVLLEKMVYVNEGQNRVVLDMDIPQGTDLQLGCPSPANLFRNNAGVNYPYALGGLMQIKSSTAGPDYYYYLYDLEVESLELCESDRVAVTGNIKTAPAAPSLVVTGSTALCPSDTVLIAVNNPCTDCSVLWSTGETGQSITVATVGTYTATLSNTCGISPTSDSLILTPLTLPSAPMVTALSSTTLCPNESVVLSASDICPDCSITWSSGETIENITISSSGTYTASLFNTCGEGPASNAILVVSEVLPEAALISASGTTTLCSGDSVLLSAENVCPDCIVHWSNGATGLSIMVATEGVFSATVSNPLNTCGEGPASNAILVTTATLPAAPMVSASASTLLCNGELLVLSAENVCSNCSVNWSTGETGASITVSTEGSYTASLSNVCGESPASNTLSITTGSTPVPPTVSAAGVTTLCNGATVILSVENGCPDCLLTWSTGETESNITVATAGNYSATFSNLCGESPASNPIPVLTGNVPLAPVISPSGATTLCPGESVTLQADFELCPDCIVQWSNGETGQNISVSAAGTYTATVSNTTNNLCGDSPASNAVMINVHPPFVPGITLDNLCYLTAPAGSNYQWFVDGSLIPQANGPSWAAAVTGNYVVSMTSPEGCAGSSAPVFAEACMSSTQQIEGLLSAKLYPNPARDQLFLDIQFMQVSRVLLDLFAADGRYVGLLFQGEISPGRQLLEITLPELPTGMYRYRLTNEKGSIQGNIVVQQQ